MSRPSPAAARAVAVINFFVEHPRQSFSLTDIVKALKLSRATCHALMATLVETGYLHRLSGKRYVIGPALVAAGRIARENYSPLDAARPEMRELAEEVDGICAALFREKFDYVIRDRAGSMFHLGWLPPIGQRTGIVHPGDAIVLAWEDERVVRDWLASRELSAEDPDVLAMYEAMGRARARGYAINRRDESWSARLAHVPIEERRQHIDVYQHPLDDETSYSISSVIAPVRDHNGISFVISLSFFRRDLTGREAKEIASKLVATCDRISDFITRAEGATP